MQPFLTARKLIPITILILLIAPFASSPGNSQEDEETYSISLVKTSDIDETEEIHEVDGKKVIAETYTVQDGDHLWQLLRERKLLEKRNLAELLSVLKKLNGSLDNIDMIHPGQKIIIPLAISPAGGIYASSRSAPPETVPLESLDGVDLEEYVVEQGDSIVKIVEELYDIPENELYNEYLSRLKQLNPLVGDLNTIYPGQKIRLPVYSPKVVRQTIKEQQPESEPITDARKEDIKLMAGELGEVFTMLGEQWLETGEHFFPLKTGGQLKLNAESYPIVELKSGKRVIVDLFNDLPERMGNLITSNWDNYSIVHIGADDGLGKAFERIISVCGYKKTYGPGVPLVVPGEIPLRIAADSIIEQEQGSTSEGTRITVINFYNEGDARTPDVVVGYLESSGINVIDYPPKGGQSSINYNEADIINAMDDVRSLVDELLGLSGLDYSREVELPAYKNGDSGVDLVVKADFSVRINGMEYIIDLSGLGKDIVNLLEERSFKVCSISDKRSPSGIVTGVFDFLGTGYDAGQHQFFSVNGPDTRNIGINIQGIIFRDGNRKDIFATSLGLSKDMILFLNMKGYRVLQLPVSMSGIDRDENEGNL